MVLKVVLLNKFIYFFNGIFVVVYCNGRSVKFFISIKSKQNIRKDFI